ncbi:MULTISPECIES: UDP-glucose 4-epimerase GalE [Streptomyces]|uniref:UDP-glucose 4-epimerase GalE n=1 Tax=Streptomyces TaxID=1883 RepID=UPI00163C277E|nr:MULTISPECIES: UDP-glucose 4-epimerase GalE [Streptomyces]MBC2878344.1 UDP-glucose 4-epimerase GalE [Streptomyces sp. TYQ1024]UBI40540.1 UDP-glucose 4-epimerase GalE [Streptomyces mobaraensis]UKW33122.1 UDP-glucose 4-epimerase GalE [Streptomyces sp. TYQ1024]
MSYWLVAGGAGFIGGHVVRAMREAGERVVVVDDLSTGSRDAVPDGVPLIEADILDAEALAGVFRRFPVEGVVNLVARTQVGESVELPLLHYRQNVEGFRTLLAAMDDAGVRKLVYSSSASVYGMVDEDLVTEATPCDPISPYGQTKLIGEWLAAAAHRAHGVDFVNLRYFNVAGAAEPRLADERVLNLVPMVFEKLTAGQAPVIFGDDYPTPDGTCVRDYIHVADIASAHLAATRFLRGRQGVARTFNVGRGEGLSVRELISVIGEVTGHDTAPVVTARRPGDPARVVADSSPIERELDWRARHTVRAMVASAWEGWCLRHPHARRERGTRVAPGA